jgi:hypothetical protein
MNDAVRSKGSKFYIGDDSSPVVYTQVKGVTNFSGVDGAASDIDITDLDSLAKEYLPGLVDNGQFNIETNYLANDPGQIDMRTARAAGTENVPFKLDKIEDGKTLFFFGNVKTAPISGAVDAKLSGSFNIKITGVVVEEATE